jgi:hypothetical protein
LNNIRREASRHFKNEMRKYPKDKINELALKIVFYYYLLTYQQHPPANAKLSTHVPNEAAIPTTPGNAPQPMAK